MACLDSARSSPPGAWLPITRRRLPSSTCTPGPWRRQARSAANLNPRWAHDSGRRHTTDQPRPYPASVSLSLSLGTGHLLKPTPGRPVRLQDRLGNGNSRSRAIAGFPAPALLRANPRQGQVPVAGGPRRSRVSDRRTPQEGLVNRCPGGVTRRPDRASRAARTGPLPGDQATVPPQDGARRDQPARPQPSWQEPDQRGQHRPVGPHPARVSADPDTVKCASPAARQARPRWPGASARQRHPLRPAYWPGTPQDQASLMSRPRLTSLGQSPAGPPGYRHDFRGTAGRALRLDVGGAICRCRFGTTIAPGSGDVWYGRPRTA
jgi:hypothetical protein